LSVGEECISATVQDFSIIGSEATGEDGASVGRHAPAEGPDLTRVSLVPGYRFHWPRLDTRRGHRFKAIAAEWCRIAQEGILV
jgi:hypothetical protein